MSLCDSLSPDTVLVLSSEVCLRKEDFGGLLFHRPALATYHLNASAFRILSIMDGKKSIRQQLGSGFEALKPFLLDVVRRGWCIASGER